MAEPHLDHPGEISWFKGEGPRTVLGSCPHGSCPHHAQSTIAWGPSMKQYELVVCDVGDAGCRSTCRAWVDGRGVATSPWLQVAVTAASHPA